MPWSARQYSRFEDQRTRPARDLVAAIPDTRVHRAVDLGCGPGNSTAVLAARYRGAAILGLDSSADMIRAARARLPEIAFEVADITDWRADAPVDVILANASLQWLPDHARLYPQLLAQLAEGGCLAVQTPDNLDTPPHRVARALAASARWAPTLGEIAHPPRHPAAWYHALLTPLCRRVDLWRTTYFHPLPDHGAVVEWFEGAALGPYLAPLDDGARREFLDAYRAGIAQALPAQADGTVLLPFPRLFVVAQV
ncbi:trans-aconitate 2-methyltransferase [Luteimonas sp. WGS1318]|uniref:trans-aconitate 2-methyltransferase n=1 Tax=Luteimonas sp. WGS1318 TaxID=3366815 RepID=UPI00372D3317